MLCENYLMYLRKSRADDPGETVEEILARHELILQNHAVKKFGNKIPESNIYREVVSGETIGDRPEIQKVLNRMESPSVLGVLVVDVQRLSRGDLIDCGTIINAFKYSHTLILTPNKTFDLTDNESGQNYDIKILKLELNSGSEYLEYTKMILNRGRNISVEKGNYIGSVAPYGYEKIVVDKNHTLKINNKEAEVVRLIFSLYLDGYGYGKIANELELLGYTPRKAKHWSLSVIKDILSNPVYIGKIAWNRRKEVKIMKDGNMTKTRPRNHSYILKDGKHPAIIDDDLFQKAQDKITNNPRIKKDRKMINPLSTLFYCKNCGHAMVFRKYSKSNPRFLCSHQKYCHTKSSSYADIYKVLIDTLIKIQENFEFQYKNQDDQYLVNYETQINNMKKELKQIEEKQDELYDLLENKIYTRDVFMKRNNKLALEREKAQNKLNKLISNMPKKIDYNKKILEFKNTISILNDETLSIETKNKSLKTIIDKIEYSIIDNQILLDVFLK